jgi:dienelactone hydrolase
MTMTLQAVTCHHANTVLEGLVAVPDSAGPHPAVLVMSNAHGLGDQARKSALLLAQLGYVALATDLYGGGALFTDTKSTSEAILPLMTNPQLLRARLVAWFETLSAMPSVDRHSVAAIGFCFGGTCVLELARSGVDVKAVVSYHGLLTTSLPAQPGAVRAHVAVYTGGKDPYAPVEQVEAFRQEMLAAGARWDITTFSEALHAFTDPTADSSFVPGLAYDERAHKVSWAGTLALLQMLLGREGAVKLTPPAN